MLFKLKAYLIKIGKNYYTLFVIGREAKDFIQSPLIFSLNVRKIQYTLNSQELRVQKSCVIKLHR